MIRALWGLGVVLCLGSGTAVFGHLKQTGQWADGTQSVARNASLSGTTVSGWFAGSDEVKTRPGIALLPQTNGVRSRGNASLAERRMRATARAMVAAAPAVRAPRDSLKQHSNQRFQSRFMRETPDAGSTGRLAEMKARRQVEANSFTGLAATLARNGGNMSLAQAERLRAQAMQAVGESQKDGTLD